VHVQSEVCNVHVQSGAMFFTFKLHLLLALLFSRHEKASKRECAVHSRDQ